jgi:hypothetical protein
MLMLSPHRFTNFDYSVINLSSLVIQCLLERGSYRLHDLLNYIKLAYEETNEQDLMLSISLLYLLGKVDYSKENDTVFIIGKTK